jgi:hypothetical protein
VPRQPRKRQNDSGGAAADAADSGDVAADVNGSICSRNDVIFVVCIGVGAAATFARRIADDRASNASRCAYTFTLAAIINDANDEIDDAAQCVGQQGEGCGGRQGEGGGGGGFCAGNAFNADNADDAVGGNDNGGGVAFEVDAAVGVGSAVVYVACAVAVVVAAAST